MHEIPFVPERSCDFWRACIEALGAEQVAAICGKSASQAWRWARDPLCSEDTQPGPLLWIRDVNAKLIEQGNELAAVGSVRLLAEWIYSDGGPFVAVQIGAPEYEDQTLAEHGLDLSEATTRLLWAAREKRSPAEVQRRADDVTRQAWIFANRYAKAHKHGTVRFSNTNGADLERGGFFAAVWRALKKRWGKA